MSELHDFILWSEATDSLEPFLDDLRQEFEIRLVVQLNWGGLASFHRRIRRFYGTKLGSTVRKMRYCGVGPFVLIVVEDHSPEYAERLTSRGPRIVNSRTFDAKLRGRALTGGGSRVHASDSEEEAVRDRAYMLGGFARSERWLNDDEAPKEAAVTPAGEGGWDSVEELVRFVALSVPSVMLRNFGDVIAGQGDRLMDSPHPDLDLLVEDIDDAALAVGGRRRPARPGRRRFETTIAGRSLGVDLRSPGDGYLPHGLARQVLANRIEAAPGLWTPDDVDHFWSLLYHAVVHRETFGREYIPMLAALAPAVGVEPSALDDDDRAVRTLLSHLDGAAMAVELPSDPSVRTRAELTERLPGAARRRVMLATWNAAKRVLPPRG